MNPLKLLLEEIRYRKLNFALSLLAVTAAATLFVAGPMLIDGYGRETDAEIARLAAETEAELEAMDKETTRIMRDMGFNLLIVHRDTNMADLWANDYAAVDMPQEYVERLAGAEELTLVTHLVATLQQRIKWNDRTVLLVGYMPEATQSHMRMKKPMGYVIEPGTVYIGHELGIGRSEGDAIEILGQPFTIAKILPEQGSKEDITIAMALEDAQRILDKPNAVNQILALGCRCQGERLPKIREQLATALPETKISEFRSIALGRAEQRDLIAENREASLARIAESRSATQQTLESLTLATTPLVVLVCGTWVGLLSLANVRQRRAEIGLLRALGKGSGHIAGLLMGKAVLTGLVGGLIGFVIGIGLAQVLGAEVLGVNVGQLGIPLDLLLWTVIGAPLVCAIAAYLPTLVAVVQPPAVVLRDA